MDEELYNDIRSGKYFEDAKEWYKNKYIHPFSHRSFVLILSVIISIIFIGLIININSLFPAVVQVKYAINDDGSANKSARIIRANQVEEDSLASIVNIMISNYVIKRESYEYERLKNQFIFIKNNSTRIVFRNFYNFMNIDNPSSPVMRYQKNIKRKVDITSIKHLTPGKILVDFHSVAINSGKEIIEDLLWQAAINYEVDKINNTLPSGSKFNFIITDYQLKLLKDKKANRS